jgi:hypothetical protein
LKGKERAVEIGTVDRLVGLLDSKDDTLKSKSALALSMYVYLIKKIILKFIIIHFLVFVLSHQENIVRLKLMLYQNF